MGACRAKYVFQVSDIIVRYRLLVGIIPLADYETVVESEWKFGKLE